MARFALPGGDHDRHTDVLLWATAKGTGPADEGGGSTSLFNGKDLTGWHVDVPELDKDPDGKQPFIVRDGLLVSLGKPGGHLITDDAFENYRLEVEYRFAGKPGNCGVLVHASTPRALYEMFPQSIECQMHHENAGDFWCIGEDITVPDMEARRGPKENWGVDGDKLRRILNLTDGSEKPAGRVEHDVIECVGDEVKVWVNGDLVNHGSKCTATQGADRAAGGRLGGGVPQGRADADCETERRGAVRRPRRLLSPWERIGARERRLTCRPSPCPLPGERVSKRALIRNQPVRNKHFATNFSQTRGSLLWRLHDRCAAGVWAAAVCLASIGRGLAADAEPIAAAPTGTAAPRSLFNGKDLAGWHIDVPAMDEDPSKNPFLVHDGLLVTLGKPGGHLITDEAFENYRLVIEYRFAAKPGNAGVVVHVDEAAGISQDVSGRAF